MTDPTPLNAVFEDLSRLQRAAFGLGGSHRSAFLTRMERLDAERGETAAHLDFELLKAREALENAWAVEIEKMIALRKKGTLDARVAAEAARNATAHIVTHIEAQRAETAEGLKVKARAGQWRRNGEPNSRRPQ